MASLDAMAWRIANLQVQVVGGPLGVHGSSLGDATVLLADLRRLIEDARHLATVRDRAAE
jgi:hypothetical protein